MKKIQFSTLLSIILLFGVNAWGQEIKDKKFNGHLRTGGILNFTDLQQSDFLGNKPDVFVSGGLAFRVDPMDADLVGDLMFGSIDGASDSTFFNTSFYGMSLNIRFDMLKWIMESKLQVRPMLGVGLLFYSAKKYDLETRNLILESPVVEDKSLSPNTSVNIGGEITYPLTDNLDMAAGYNHTMIFGNDWFDGELYDVPFDQMGMIHFGFVFGFGGNAGWNRNTKRINPDRDAVELTHEEYASLVYRIDSLKRKLGEVNIGELNSLRDKADEQAATIDSMDVVIDSLRAGVYNLFANDSAGLSGVGDANYRLVLTSTNSRALAQEFIDRSASLDQSKMHIMKIPDEERYLIFYKSFDNILKARKEKGQIKGVAPNAWIARL